MDENKLKEMLSEIRCQALKCAAVSLVSDVILKAIFSPKCSKVVVDKDLPAEIIAIGKNDSPATIYVSTNKRKKINLFPFVACIAIAGTCHYVLCKKLN